LTRRIPSKHVLILAGLCLLTCVAQAFDAGFAETEGAIRIWQRTHGLPADSVTAIIQTRDGFLWLGTSEGLFRFDGDKFTPVLLTGRAINNSLWVTALAEDARGHLWIGTQQDGLFKLAEGQIHQYTAPRHLLDSSVTSLAADNHGQVWIGTKSGLSRARDDEFKSFTVADGLRDELVTGVAVARSGPVWITTRGGMCQYTNEHIVPYEFPTDSQGRRPEYLGAYEDRRGNLWAFGDTYLINLTEGKRFNYFRGNEATSVRIWSLCEGRDGRLWIGTSGRGLFCFDDNRFQPVMLGELRWPYDVRAICEDREGNLWLGTSGGGLVQLRPQPVHTLRASVGLPTSQPTALALDAMGRVCVGYARGGLFVSEGGRFERFSGGHEVQDFVTSLAIAPEGTLWAGTLGGGLYALAKDRLVQFTTAHGLADNLVLAVCADHEGGVWASTSAGTVHYFQGQTAKRFDVGDGLTGSPVTVLLTRTSGEIWLGAEDGAVLRHDRGKFMLAQAPEKVERRPILALSEGEQGRLWIGTAGGGLACLANGNSTVWNTRNGLPNDVVAGVVEDATRNLWLATSAGIYRVTHSAVTAAQSDPSVALACKLMSDAKTSFEAATVFGGRRALQAREGKLWFATSESVLQVDTRRTQVEQSPLPVYLENVTFLRQPPLPLLRTATWASGISNNVPLDLSGDVRSLEFRFTALNFTAPDKTRFRHMLEGFDQDWVEDGPARSKRYDRLPYGRYKFRVAAHAGDGDWQEAPMAFAFVLPTPLYLQPWAIGLYCVAAIALVAGIVREVSHRRLRHALAQLEQQQALERERMRIARDMHDEIGSKLTKISFLSEHAKVDAKSAGPLAAKVESIAVASRELLQTMDEIVWVVNPRNDSLEHLAAYLSHYADEYFQNTSVECEVRLPRAIPHHPLSSEARHNLFLTFEETLNNVLKHSGATKVKVEMNLTGLEFEINVTDDGRGFDLRSTPAGNGNARGQRGGNGLRNMRQRLADIGGECIIRSQPGQGTSVSLKLRLNGKAGRIA